MTAAPILPLLERLPAAAVQSNGWWRARCPAHEDKAPSFGWTIRQDGSVGLKCQAGCTAEEIVAAVGATMADLFTPRANGAAAMPRPARRSPVVRERRWPARLAEDGSRPEARIEHVRLDRADGSKHCWWELDGKRGLGGIRTADLALYGADRLAGIRDEPVVVAEGEPATDALLAAGIPAVGTVTGAGNPLPCAAAWAALTARPVVLWPDADDQGRKHMAAIAVALRGLAPSVRWITPPDGVEPAWDAADADAGLARRLVTGAGPMPGPGAGWTLAEAVEATHGYVTRYVVFPSPHEPVALVLWAAHAWAVDAAEVSPYLAITSPEKRSGKTRALEVLEMLCPRPWRAVTPSPAALYRKIEADRPTLLLDEVDAIFGSRRQAERNEDLRAILNAGNRAGSTVVRVVGEGKRMKVQDFRVYGPKGLAAIGDLPDTIADRAIPIRLERRARSEPVERFRIREAEARAVPIREGLEGALAPLIDRLAAARPAIPSQLGDRAADSWEPLLAIADVAGSTWPERARAAAVALSGERLDDLDDATASVLFLADLRAMFDRHGTDRLTSAQIVAELVADDERPWATWRHGGPITAHGMGRLLRPYRVKPDVHRFGETRARGYLRADLADAWARYLPPPTDASERVPVDMAPVASVAGRAPGVPLVNVSTLGTPAGGRAGENGVDLVAAAQRIFGNDPADGSREPEPPDPDAVLDDDGMGAPA